MRFKDKTYHFNPATIPMSATHVIKDVSYASGNRHTLDIYLPKTTYQPFPVIFDLYGGGLLRGQKSSSKLNPSLRFLADGFAVISMDYTLNSPTHSHFPTQISEIREALLFLTHYAHLYQLDMSQLTLIGESSGAQLALLAAASFSAKKNIGENHSLKHFPKISHVIGLYGPYQVDQFTAQFAELGITPEFSETGSSQSFEGIMLRNNRPDSVPNLVKQANPATYFTHNMPPLMLIAGTQDPVVPYLQSVTLAQQYQTLVGRPAKTIWVTDGVHGPKDYDVLSIYKQKLAFIKNKQKSDD